MQTLYELIPVLMVFVVFYVAVIRPPRKAEAKRLEAVRALTGGEEVVLSNGILATITTIEGDVFKAEISEDVEVKVLASAITSVRGVPMQAPAVQTSSSRSDEEQGAAA